MKPLTLLMPFVCLVFMSCEKDMLNHKIVGEWRLVEVQQVFLEPSTYDYSGNSIIYTFRPNGVFAIKSDIDEHQGRKSGEYSYRIEPVTGDNGETIASALVIEQLTYGLTISGNEMTISAAPLDGPIMTFVKH